MEAEKTSLYQLGNEYEKHMILQDYFIKKCKNQIKKAEMSGDYNAVAELKGRLRKFYEIRYELEQTAIQLKNYYKR